MRTLLLLALCSLRLVAAVSFDNYKDGGYSGSGAHTTTIVASGTNLGCIVVTWYRSGSTGTPTCGGNAMTKLSTMATTICSGAATVDTWGYFGAGLTAGTLTVSITATVESVLEAFTVNGARQTGQPDALAAHATGTSAGNNGIGLPITTVANNSLVMGTFCAPVTGNVSTSNGTWIGNDGNVGFHFWRSTADVSPSGSFALQGGASTDGYVMEGNGLSISPPPSGVNAYTSNPTVIVVGP